MKEYILSIDQGTTATKVALYAANGQLKALSNNNVRQYYPENGWVEHDPYDILSSIKRGIEDVIVKAKITNKKIISIAIANQGETIIPFDRYTGEPLYNAIVWQDRRTNSFCNQLKNNIDERVITEKTGLFLDPYFSASKFTWLINHVKKVKKAIHKGSAVLATSDVWILYMLTGGKSIRTDVTTASRTMLYNINSLEWDDELLDLFNIPKHTMPEVVPSAYNFGLSDPAICNGISAHIYASLVDQQASLFGHACFYKGEVKITYGTGGFLLLNIGKERIKLNDKIVTTITAQYDNDINYAIDGGVYCVGSCINWLINELKIVSNPKQIDDIAFNLKDNCGTYFIPSFAGISVPYWKSDTKGAFFGLSFNTTERDIIRAVLEGIAYRFFEIIEIVKKNGFREISTISVDGGVSKNDFLMQYQANLFGIQIKRPTSKEMTSLGGFYLAGLKSGLWKDVKSLRNRTKIKKIFYPEKDNSKKINNFNIWKSAVKSVVNWHNDLNILKG